MTHRARTAETAALSCLLNNHTVTETVLQTSPAYFSTTL